MNNARWKKTANLLRDVQFKLRGNVDARVIQDLQEVIDELENEELNAAQAEKVKFRALRVLGEVIRYLPAIKQLFDEFFG